MNCSFDFELMTMICPIVILFTDFLFRFAHKTFYNFDITTDFILHHKQCHILYIRFVICIEIECLSENDVPT